MVDCVKKLRPHIYYDTSLTHPGTEKTKKISDALKQKEGAA